MCSIYFPGEDRRTDGLSIAQLKAMESDAIIAFPFYEVTLLRKWLFLWLSYVAFWQIYKKIFSLCHFTTGKVFWEGGDFFTLSWASKLILNVSAKCQTLTTSAKFLSQISFDSSMDSFHCICVYVNSIAELSGMNNSQILGVLKKIFFSKVLNCKPLRNRL